VGPALQAPTAMRAIVLAASLTIASTGCAALMKDPPKPDRRPSEAPQCSSAQGAVVLDGIMAAALGIGALVALSEGGDGVGVGLGLGLIATAYGGSAYSGNSSATRCEVERKKYAAWQREQDRRGEVDEVAARSGAGLANPPAPPPATSSPGGPVDPFASPDSEDAAPAPAAPTASAASPRAPDRPDRADPWRDFWKEVTP
jgi:hypothetical protein